MAASPRAWIGQPKPEQKPARRARGAPAVRHGVDRHRKRVWVVAELACGRGEPRARVHRRVRRHRERVAPRRLAQRPCGHRVAVALHAEAVLDLVVERLELVVVEQPVGDRRARHRAVERASLEVLAPEPRHLRVPVDGPTADGGRQPVDVAHERARDAAPRLRARPPRARLEQQILVLVEARRLDRVVGEPGPQRAVAAEAREQVAALLEDEHRMAGLGQRPGRDAPARPRANDDDRRPAHGPSASHQRSRRAGRPPRSGATRASASAGGLAGRPAAAARAPRSDRPPRRAPGSTRAAACRRARGRGDVHAGIADRGRDPRQRPGGVLDVDDQVDCHVSHAPPSGRWPVRHDS